MSKAFFIHTFSSPLGLILSIGNNSHLYALRLMIHRVYEEELQYWSKKLSATFIEHASTPLLQVQTELEQYFEGQLISFSTPLHLEGTVFQKSVWDELRQTQYAELCSYKDIGLRINNPKAYRAVAQACKKNPIAILIPCHRIIQSSGLTGGYNGGINLKIWLNQHECHSI